MTQPPAGASYTITTTADQDAALTWVAGAGDPAQYLQDRNNEILDSYVRNHKLAQTPVPTVDVATAYAYADAATQAQVVTTLGLDQPETAAQARGRTAGMPPVT